jgi:hypothetical protein
MGRQIMNEICKRCGSEGYHEDSKGHEFEPSGLVSVPVEFVEAVREYLQTGEENLYDNINSMLAAIDGKEKSHE